MLADKKGMLLQECLEKCSHREYLGWIYFYREQWKELSLTDYHLLRVSQRVHQGWAKHANKIMMEHQMIIFEGEKKKEPKLSVEERTAVAKSRWGGYLEAHSVKPKMTKAENK